jgi:adenosylcobinamide-GDP ribazoletransferase
MNAAWAGLRLAVGTLTMIPVGHIPPPTRRVGAWSMALAPVAALPLGVLVAATCLLGRWLALPALVTASLSIGALHLDGLADTADGIGAGWDRERALRVLRTGDVGPMGVAAVLVVVLVQIAAVAALQELARGWLIVGAAVVASRVAATLGCLRGLPPAEGSTLGVVVASTVPGPVGAVVVGATAAALTTAGTLAGLPWWQGAAAVVALLAVVGWVVRSALRVFGGINGDVLGAVIEVGLGTLLVVLTVGIAS